MPWLSLLHLCKCRRHFRCKRGVGREHLLSEDPREYPEQPRVRRGERREQLLVGLEAGKPGESLDCRVDEARLTCAEG